MLVGVLMGLSLLSLSIWIYLIAARGGFWRARERLDGPPGNLPEWPSVAALVPARNESEVLRESLSTLLRQNYPGPFHVILIDDHSEDGTADIARQAAIDLGQESRLTVTQSGPLPSGWAGKVWALSEGLQQAPAVAPAYEYLLLTDADIAHDAFNLRRLVAKARSNDLDLVSQMVVLVSEGFWARLLIPAFVLFFQKLYPFAWVNDPAQGTAAAAGGCVLLDRRAIERIGGFQGLHDALIDDCTLAALIKQKGRDGGGRLWLGLTTAAESLRPYHGLQGIWQMVTRSAYTQLRRSPILLAGTVLGMVLIYWIPPIAALYGWIIGAPPITIMAVAAWSLMLLAFLPILRLYKQSILLAPLLPLAGLMYSLMTIDSAIAHWRGRGGAWKGRIRNTAEN
jgi:hopene-associated glycosyltransferase HpnB